MKRNLQRFALVFAGFLVPVIYRQQQPVFTLKEVVAVLADYEVHHPKMPNVTPFWGVTDYENKAIFVIENADTVQRRKTVIHELQHVIRYWRGETLPDRDAEEQEIQAQTEITYRELFEGER